MRLSLLQPEIRPGDVEHNVRAAQQLIDEAEGDLLVLPEYALTGPPPAGEDIAAWAERGAAACEALTLPVGKALLVNCIRQHRGGFANRCELLGTGQQQVKLHLTAAEREAGMIAGDERRVFSYQGRRFAVFTSSRLEAAQLDAADDLDFVLWLTHFERAALSDALARGRDVSAACGLRIFMNTLLVDEWVSLSAYVDGYLQLAVPRRLSIMEVAIA